MHAIHIGPAKGLNQVRTPKHGSIVAGRMSLHMTLNDGRQVQIALDSWADMVQLAHDMLGQIPNIELTLLTLGDIMRWAKKQDEGQA